ncbi:hypothetical protein EVAR_66790_1 [Eumeta japonica]|uniref:Uncharacterized protein n=1 Tax=Eumeta variegata TaxID=151549 RepID=A0A4C1ZZF0_EUMVA|nr:hypothetical protein EVAR_66790_1 [Eumeta japonica]
MIHTYLFIYSFNIAVAVAVVVLFGAVSQEYGSPAPAPLLLRSVAARLRPTARLSECCRSLLSLALGIRSIRVKTESVRDRFFSSSISLAADRPAGSSPRRTRASHHLPVRSPIRSRCARVNPPLANVNQYKRPFYRNSR